MNTGKIRKTDRRTLYTKNIIKDSLLELMAEREFDRLSVSAVCKQAEITRATFYIHYDNLSMVLDETINDALQLAEDGSPNFTTDLFNMLNIFEFQHTSDYLKEHESMLPPCQRAADNPKYNVLFKDESIYAYIIKTIFNREKESVVPQLMELTGLNRQKSLLLFTFMLNGSYAINKQLGWKKDSLWYEMQADLLTFSLNGYNALKSKYQK